MRRGMKPRRTRTPTRSAVRAWGRGRRVRLPGRAGCCTNAKTGLCLLTFRCYDPSAGGFLTRNLKGRTGGVILYAYRQSKPLHQATLLLSPRRRFQCADSERPQPARIISEPKPTVVFSVNVQEAQSRELVCACLRSIIAPPRTFAPNEV